MEVIYLSRGQAQIFLFYLAAGLLIGVLYSLFFALRLLLGKNKAAVFITDIGWGISAGLFFASVGVVINHGEIRAYTVIATLLGFALYIFFVQKPLANTVKTAYNWLSPKAEAFERKHTEKRTVKFLARQTERTQAKAERDAESVKRQAIAGERKAEKKRCLQEKRRTKQKLKSQPPSTTER